MNFAWYALWFIVAVSLLVTVHEFGHFWVARRLGFKVLRFSVGFGRPLIERTGKDGTVYAIAMLPLGGYVKLLDEREGPVATAELSRSFTRKPPWQRILVLLAGPAFNIIFAILVLWGMFWHKGTLEEPRPVVGDVVAESIASKAGLRSGDRIVALDGEPVQTRRNVIFGLMDAVSANGRVVLTVQEGKDGPTRPATLQVGDGEDRRKLTEPMALFNGHGFQFWEPPVPAVIAKVEPGSPAAGTDLRKGDRLLEANGRSLRDYYDLLDVISKTKPGDELNLRYDRNGEAHSVRVLLGSPANSSSKKGYLGVWPVLQKLPQDMIVTTTLTPYTALGAAAYEAWDMTLLQARLVWRMLMGNVSLKNLSGPLSIAEFAGDSASDGVNSFMNFLVLISLSLGFLNLLPIPILDGGQVVFQLVEWLKGSPLSERAQAFGQQVGIALLILLMGVALFNDVARQIGPQIVSGP